MRPEPTGLRPHLPPNRAAYTKEAHRQEAAAEVPGAVEATGVADHHPKATVHPRQAAPDLPPPHHHHRAEEGSFDEVE